MSFPPQEFRPTALIARAAAGSWGANAGELVVTKGVVVAGCVDTKYTAAVKGTGARWVGGR